MRLSNRLTVLTLVVTLTTAACTTPSTTETTETTPVTASPSTSMIPEVSTTTSTTTPTEATPDTTEPIPELFRYAVVAEEQARRLAVIDPSSPCVGDAEPCELAPVLTVELPERPHNMAAVGAVVYATHPAAGSVSRVDLASGDVATVVVGTEPHDIKYAPSPGVLYVADEDGRALLTLDADTLEVIDEVEMPAKPHDLVVAGDTVWVTLIGRPVLARVRNGEVELVPTGGSPHDLIIDQDGTIWFSNWNSHVLNIFDPEEGTTVEAPAGVSEPHHFAIDPSGAVWVSDNGGSAVVGFTAEGPVTMEVGPVPHHPAFVGDTLVVAVSGSGEAVFIRDGQIVARSPLTTGLHGVAVVELEQRLTVVDE